MTSQVTRFPFDFQKRTLGPELGRFVESIWYARGTVPYTREKIAPTGSTVAVFVLGDAILETSRNGAGTTIRAERGFLTGPHDGPAINEPTGETFAVGVVCTPIGCEPVFHQRPSPLRGRVVDLVDAWEPAARLRSSLIAASTPTAMLDLLEHELERSCGSATAGHDRCEQAVELIEADPIRPIAAIAKTLGLSHGHLDHEFTRIVGLTPRSLARLLRMRLLLTDIDIETTTDWSELAGRYGWFDQAHMIRDFKRHTGVTPTRYVAAQRAAFGAADADAGAGVVPEF